MNLSLVKSSILSALFAHLGGIAALFLLALFGIKSEDPRAALIWLGVIALVVGALLCGLFARVAGNGLGGSLLSAALFVLPALVAWIFGGDPALILPVKLGILAGCAGIILTLSLALPKPDGSRRSRRSVRRSMERRLR